MHMHTTYAWPVLTIAAVAWCLSKSVFSLPAKKPQFGPCIGMNCLHGVLMHADAKQGEAHTTEDKEKTQREKEAEEAGRKTKPPSQVNQEEYIHGVLMHGSKDFQHEDVKAKIPKANKKPGPIDQEAYLHGVLMHGDKVAGQSHEVEDKEKKRLADLQAKVEGKRDPPTQMNQEEYMHGVLMHGDKAAGETHNHKNFDVEQKPKANKQMDQEEYLHGVLMHGDTTPGKDHKHEKNPNLNTQREGIATVEVEPRKEEAEITKTFNSQHNHRESEQQEETPMHPSELRQIKKRKTWIQRIWEYFTEESVTNKREQHNNDAHNVMEDLSMIGNTAPSGEQSHHKHQSTDRIKKEHNNKAHNEH